MNGVDDVISKKYGDPDLIHIQSIMYQNEDGGSSTGTGQFEVPEPARWVLQLPSCDFSL